MLVNNTRSCDDVLNEIIYYTNGVPSTQKIVFSCDVYSKILDMRERNTYTHAMTFKMKLCITKRAFHVYLCVCVCVSVKTGVFLRHLLKLLDTWGKQYTHTRTRDDILNEIIY